MSSVANCVPWSATLLCQRCRRRANCLCRRCGSGSGASMGMMVGLTLGPATPPSRRMAGSGAASLGVPLAMVWPLPAGTAGGTSRLHSSSSSNQAWKALPP
ncbi:hypothetical protein G6F56_014180 [Rhizopus delemar]|nr:hypothetical protein G6F56_014180 [Rhizopus delemar]